MKINRFIALAAIALLVVGAMGAISMKVFAQTSAQTENCDQQDEDAAEVQGTADTDNVESECGDQTEAESADGAESESAGDVESAPTGTPAITSAAAQKTAEAYLNAGKALKVDFDDEDGKLVYSVEFSNGTDVRVDAMTGEVLGTEPTED